MIVTSNACANSMNFTGISLTETYNPLREDGYGCGSGYTSFPHRWGRYYSGFCSMCYMFPTLPWRAPLLLLTLASSVYSVDMFKTKFAWNLINFSEPIYRHIVLERAATCQKCNFWCGAWAKFVVVLSC